MIRILMRWWPDTSILNSNPAINSVSVGKQVLRLSVCEHFDLSRGWIFRMILSSGPGSWPRRRIWIFFFFFESEFFCSWRIVPLSSVDPPEEECYHSIHCHSRKTCWLCESLVNLLMSWFGDQQPHFSCLWKELKGFPLYIPVCEEQYFLPLWISITHRCSVSLACK